MRSRDTSHNRASHGRRSNRPAIGLSRLERRDRFSLRLRHSFAFGRSGFVLVRSRGRDAGYSNTSRRSRGYLANARLSRFGRRDRFGLGRRFILVRRYDGDAGYNCASHSRRSCRSEACFRRCGRCDCFSLSRGRRSFFVDSSTSRRGRGSHHDRLSGDRSSLRRNGEG
jgi:hypothetical protein